MTKLKRLLLYVFLSAVLALTVYGLFGRFVSDCLSSAIGGTGGVEWFDVSAGEEGTVWALGVRDGEVLVTRGTSGGGRAFLRRLPDLGIDGAWQAGELFACSEGAMLSVTESTQTGEPVSTRVYWISDDAKTATLVSNCQTGETETVVSSFSEYDGTVHFLIQQDSECSVYAYSPGGEGVQATGTFPYSEEVRTALVLSDGTILLTGPSGMQRVCADGTAEGEVTRSPIGKIWAAEDGAYLLDLSDGELLSFSLDSGALTQCTAQLADGASSVSVAPDGEMVTLNSSDALTLTTADAQTDISPVLHRSGPVSILILAAITLAILFTAYALWYLLCEFRRMRISMVVRKGMAMLVLLALLCSAAVTFGVEPYFDALAQTAARDGLALAVSIATDGKEPDAQTLKSAADDLAAADARNQNTELLLFSADDLPVVRAASGGTAEGACLAALLRGPGFAAGYRSAAESGENVQAFFADGTDHFAYFQKLESGCVIAAVTDASAFYDEADSHARRIVAAIWGAGALLSLLIFLLLLRVRSGVCNIIVGMDSLNSGSYNVEVLENSGDELEALTDSFNTLAQTMRGAASGSKSQSDSYMRFVPQQIITLLGASSVEQVDKHTFASRYMATMRVRFTFDEKIYESRTRELFDNINEVIERTAPVVPQNHGTVYGFSYEGFEALFDADNDAAVSAAVAMRQEVIALNRERAQRGLSPVTLQVALDVGNVMLGVVGDETRMEATAISASFNTTRCLTALFGRFEANILCTESVISRAEGYGSRYIGKTRDGDLMIRVYEIYDGDAYASRTGKASTAQRFSEGVYTLYSRDYSGAKRIFMDIARQNNSDGVAKFYLYLADRFEKDAPDEISMDN